MDRTFPPFILYCFDLRPPTESEACFWYAFSVWSAMTGAAVTPQPKPKQSRTLASSAAGSGWVAFAQIDRLLSDQATPALLAKQA